MNSVINAIKYLLPVIVTVFLISPVAADWAVVDDFEDGDISDWSHSYNEAQTDPTTPLPEIKVIDDPFAGSANKILSVFPGTLIEGVINSHSYKPLPSPIVDNFPNATLSTLFFRIARPTVMVDGVEVPAEQDLTFGLTSIVEPASYGSYSVVCRFQPDGILDAHDGSYADTDTEAFVTKNWYSVWYIIDHSNNSFKVYVQGGPQYPQQTLVYPHDGNPDAQYRLDTYDDLVNFYVITSTGSVAKGAAGRDPTYFDDVYVDVNAANLTDPSGASSTEMWGIYPISEVNGVRWADTGDWLGWLAVQEGDEWVYSNDLSDWLYFATPPTEEGAWVYAIK